MYQYDEDAEYSMLWEAYHEEQHDHDASPEQQRIISPVPSSEIMQRRYEFRKSIQETTLQHRRIHRHGGIGETSRHVCLSLLDRERHGARHVVLQRKTMQENSNIMADASMHDNNETTTTTTTLLKRKEKKQSPLSSLRRASLYPKTVMHELTTFAEYSSVVRYHSSYLHHLGGPGSIQEPDEDEEDDDQPTSTKAVSTISVAFSPDAQNMASTHGDHTVKITCCSTGDLLRSLDGHPRTPWTVKFHPTDPHVLASGCLGFQVRVWDWNEGKCLHMIRLDYAIISLSFHPAGNILAVASGSRIHFWDYANHGGNGSIQESASGDAQRQTRGALTDVEQRHMLRCVHFPPNGTTLIVGGMNPNQDDTRRQGQRLGGMHGGGMSFYLRLWDFDEDAALHPFTHQSSTSSSMEGGTSRTTSLRTQKKSLSNPRTFVPRALLYNDGGFDVSPDGKTLCACAEFWLPEGVNSAMELLQREEREYDSSQDDDDDVDFMSDEEAPVPMSPATVMATPPTSTPRNSAHGAPESLQDTPQSGRGASYSTPPRRRLARQSETTNSSSSNEQRDAPASNPHTPPNQQGRQQGLSPPPPPGLRFAGGLGQQSQSFSGRGSTRLQPLLMTSSSEYPLRGANSSIPPPPASGLHNLPLRPPHPLSIVTASSMYKDVSRQPGRYVPHVVTISLDTAPISPSAYPVGPLTSVACGYRPRLGQLLEACPLDGSKASAVTCVKFSPTADFCLLGYGVREPVTTESGQDSQYHPVTSLFRISGGMTHVSTMLSGDDDVNIARFHPDSGYGFVYGTKQGRVRVSAPRPWNFYSVLPEEKEHS